MITFITLNKGIVNAMISTSTSNVLSPTSAFHLMVTDHKCRTLLTFENKRQYFLDNLRKPHVKSGALLNEVPVRVRRSHILEDSFHVLSELPMNELYGTLSINYDAEEGVDAGGLLRDWYLQLFRSLLNPMYGLFEFSSDGSTYQPAGKKYLYLRFVHFSLKHSKNNFFLNKLFLTLFFIERFLFNFIFTCLFLCFSFCND